MNKILSFIVPVYNVRDYVIRCLRTLVNQNIPVHDYEIIVIIDGSPDDSFELVSEFAKDYNHIKIINQDNQGLSEARNNGFKNSQGKYVWFVDSDDWITENCLKQLLEVMEEENLDMFGLAPSIPFQTNFEEYYDKGASLTEVFSGKDGIVNSRCVIGAWCYIFRADFLRENQLSFLKGIFFEDQEFIPRALYLAQRVMMLTNFSVYSYFIREGSIMNTVSEKHVFDKLKVAESLNKFLHVIVQKKERELARHFQRSISGLIIAGLNDICRIPDGRELLNKYIKEAQERGVYPLTVVKTNLSFGLLVFLCNLSPSIYYRLRKK